MTRRALLAASRSPPPSCSSRRSPAPTTSRTPTSPCRSRRPARCSSPRRSRSAAPFHGAYRDIPLRKGESIDRISVAEGGRRYSRGGSTELGSIDRSGHVQLRDEREAGADRLALPAPPANRARSRSRYRFRGLTVAHDDVVDVNLKVWGDEWTEPLAQPDRDDARCPGRSRSGRATASGATRPGCNGDVARAPQVGDAPRASNVPGHQFVELRVVFPRRVLTSTAGAKVGRGSGLGGDRRGGGRRRRPSYRHDQRTARRREAPSRARRSSASLLLALGPALARRSLLVWLVYGRERAHRLRPRVRAGAADRHRAGARPAAPAPGDRGRLAASSRRRSST